MYVACITILWILREQLIEQSKQNNSYVVSFKELDM